MLMLILSDVGTNAPGCPRAQLASIWEGHDFSRAAESQLGLGLRPRGKQEVSQMPGGVKTEVRTYQMFINGEWVASKSSKTFPVYDPSTEETIAQVPDASADDVNRAVAAAKTAFEEGPWSTTTAQERGRVLFRLAEKVRANLPALAELECRNTGKPIVEAEFDINDAATCFKSHGGLATKVV